MCPWLTYKGWSGDLELRVCEEIPAHHLIGNDLATHFEYVSVVTRSQNTEVSHRELLRKGGKL